MFVSGFSVYFAAVWFSGFDLVVFVGCCVGC